LNCIRCRQGFTWECTGDPCDRNKNQPDTDDAISFSNGGLSVISDEEDLEGEPRGGRGRVDSDHNLKDQQSTGRKRAAVDFPLDREAPCEWKMKRNCGGGPKPIVGCINGLQQARHHGPDKNTLNNDVGNVHRICHTCHNRWHTENDPIYAWGTIQNPHSPVEATLEQAGENELYWAGRTLVKATD
jgi:hypothetical protein